LKRKKVYNRKNLDKIKKLSSLVNKLYKDIYVKLESKFYRKKEILPRKKKSKKKKSLIKSSNLNFKLISSSLDKLRNNYDKKNRMSFILRKKKSRKKIRSLIRKIRAIKRKDSYSKNINTVLLGELARELVSNSSINDSEESAELRLLTFGPKIKEVLKNFGMSKSELILLALNNKFDLSKTKNFSVNYGVQFFRDLIQQSIDAREASI